MAVINNRLSKPILHPLADERKRFAEIFLGIELEYESAGKVSLETSAEKIIEGLGDFVILKNDASLEHGFEICSRPASLDQHKKTWPLFFNNYLSDLRVLDNCGMHVHVSREPLSELQIGKIVAFIHSKENYKFMRKIAGRDSNAASNYKFPLSLNFAKRRNYVQLVRELGVNLHNQATIELRIFRSTTDLSTFFKNLEFCNALVDFTSPSHRNIPDSIAFQKFVEFLQTEEPQYPYLYRFLQLEKFIKI